jgi:hypothetical protein
MSYDSFRKVFTVTRPSGEVIGAEVVFGPNRGTWSVLVQGHPIDSDLPRPSDVVAVLDKLGTHDVDFRHELQVFPYRPVLYAPRVLPAYE